MDSMKVLAVRDFITLNPTQPQNYFYWKIYLLNFDIFPTKNLDIGLYNHGTIRCKIWNTWLSQEETIDH
jgi:hypothetical protein